MKLIQSIKQAIEILKLNTNTIADVAKSKKATNAGILLIVIGGFIAGIASKSMLVISIMPIVAIISSFIGIGILHFTAKLFKGKAEFIELYRVLAHANILNWLGIFSLIPAVATIVAVITSTWGLIVNFVVIKNIYKLSTLRTVFVIIIPLILLIITLMIGTTIYMTTNPEGAASLFGV